MGILSKLRIQVEQAEAGWVPEPVRAVWWGSWIPERVMAEKVRVQRLLGPVIL